MNAWIAVAESRQKARELIGETFKGFITFDRLTVWELAASEIYSAIEIE